MATCCTMGFMCICSNHPHKVDTIFTLFLIHDGIENSKVLISSDDSLEKSLMLGEIEGRRRRGHQRMRWLDGISDAIDMNLGKLREMVRDREAWPAAVCGVTESWTWLRNWTTTINPCQHLPPLDFSWHEKKNILYYLKKIHKIHEHYTKSIRNIIFL